MHSALRRRLSTLALMLGAACPVAADTFPARPITLVVPQGPGSGSDVTARLLAAHLGPELGQTVVVENRAGGSGILAHQSVMRAPADGYTLLFSSTAQLVVVPMINASARYQLADFTAVAPVLRAPFAVLVASDAAAPKTAKDLADRLRASPQSYASAGIGTMTHLGAELWLRAVGVKATHVPYKGSGQALTDLMGGQVLFAVDSLTASMTHLRSGRLRALAVMDAQRKASLPDVLTTDETGAAGAHAAVVAGLFAPKGLPQERVERLAAAMVKVLAMPDVQQKMAATESEPLSMPAATFVRMLEQEATRWGPLVRDLGIKSE
jgi:tripartite-type tricarboxylate transporter receptor subunit TctC